MVRWTRMLAALAPLWVGSALAAQPAAPVHVRGDVVRSQGKAVTIATASGRQLTVQVPAGAPVAQVHPAQLSDLSKGDYVGTTAVPQKDGTLRAIEVHIFPASMRGVGEGQAPWDRGPGSSMTNATVGGMGSGSGGASAAAAGSSSMTNATVSSVGAGGGGQTLQLQYQGGSATVAVPPGTTIVKLSPGSHALLKPGAHVFAVATRQPDGTLVAQRLNVGEGSVVPPM